MNNLNSKNIYLYALLIVLLMLNVFSAWHKSITYDEIQHYDYGVRILEGHASRYKITDDSKMPVSALNAIPKMAADLSRAHIKSSLLLKFLGNMKTGRFMTMLFSLFLALFVFKWSNDLYGWWAGVFSLFLYVFSPNIIAHSRLITTDLFGVAFCFISTYYFWRFIKFGGIKRCIISAVFLGLAQLTKYTAVYLVPVFFIILTVKYLPDITMALKAKNFKALAHYFLSSAKSIFIFLAIILLVINAGFLFQGTFKPLKEYNFKSELFQKIQNDFKNIEYLPVVVPEPYISGLDWVKFNERSGTSFGNIYLFEELRNLKDGDTAFKSYYFFAFLYKTPIPVLILIIISLLYYWKKQNEFNIPENEVFLIVPILFFCIYFNFMFKAQIGIRFLLVIYPFLYVLCGVLLKDVESLNQKFKLLLICLSVYLVASVMSYFPHYLSYFNELVWDRKMAYKVLADSNIDWGQNEWYLQQYRNKNPEVILRPNGPVKGKFIVSVNELVGIFSRYKYQWVRDNLEPVGHIGYSYLIYELTADDVKRLQGKI